MFFPSSYKSKYKYYDQYEYGDYQLNKDKSKFEMVNATTQDGRLGEHEVLIGLLGGVAYKTNLSKLRFTVMRLQSGESKAGQFYIDNNSLALGQSGYLAYANNLQYNERSLTNALLNGKHVLNNTGWEVDWRISPTLSISNDPDIRKTAFTFGENDTTFSAGAGGNPTRIWRELKEISLSSKFDITKKYKFKGNDASLKFGASYTYKDRDYEIIKYDLVNFGGQPTWNSLDANLVLIPENIYPYGANFYYQTDYSNPNPNEYSANSSNIAFYLSNEFNVFAKLKTTLGLRFESFVMNHTGRDQAGAQGSSFGKVLKNEKVLNSFDMFPSINLIYTLSNEQNLRASFSRTTARPSFKELSFAQIIDPLSNTIFNGALHVYGDGGGNLSATYINNYDLRWEVFLKEGQMFSVSGFYKQFEDPIELVRIPEQQTSTEYQPRNVGDGNLMGLELEFRKNLAFMSLNNLNLSGNLTLVDSKVEMTDTEYNSRKSLERNGEDIDNKRVMAGQAPYVINAGITYGLRSKGFDAGIFYNVKGETLSIVGGGIFPDVYVKPFNSLNLSVNKKFGQTQRLLIEFKVSNLLNNDYDEVYQAYKAQDQTFKKYSPGQSFSIGVKYKL